MTDPLAEILNDSRVQAARTLRDSYAARARATRARHVRHSRGFVIGTSVAAVAGALILYGAGGEPSETADTISETLFEWLAADTPRTVLFSLQVIALAAAAYAAQALRSTASGGDWLRERRAAELSRIDLHATILAVAAKRGPTYETAAFEHFLGAQLADQLAFYRAAEVRHRAEFNRTATVGAVVAAAAATAGATAGLSSSGAELWIAAAAGVGVVAPILASAVRSWQEATLDHEKAERYHEAWSALTRLEADADEARRALKDGDPTAARDLVAKVHAVLRSEQSAWTPTKSPT